MGTLQIYSRETGDSNSAVPFLREVPKVAARKIKDAVSDGKATATKKKTAVRKRKPRTEDHRPRVPKDEKSEWAEITPPEEDGHIGPGRPQIEIDKDVFENLCRIQCTKLEIASWFGCNDETISNWCKKTYVDEDGKPMNFLESYKRFAEHGKISLRRQMVKSANSGNVTMQIFLAKNMLGMSDKTSVDVESSSGIQIYFPDNGRPDVLGE